MAQPSSNLVPTLLLVPLVGFALYRRLRKSFGKQRYVPQLMIARMALFGLLCAGFVVYSHAPAALLAGVGGLAVGVGLARVGINHTTFETTAEGVFYTPNKWLGLVVTALFVARLVGRIATVSDQVMTAAEGGVPLRSPQTAVTLGLFCLMAAYYVAYYAWIMARARGLKAEGPAPETAALQSTRTEV